MHRISDGSRMVSHQSLASEIRCVNVLFFGVFGSAGAYVGRAQAGTAAPDHGPMDRFKPGPPRGSVAPPGYAATAVSSQGTRRPFPRHLEALRGATKVHGKTTAFGHGAVVPVQAFEATTPPPAAVLAAEARAAAERDAAQRRGRFQRGA